MKQSAAIRVLNRSEHERGLVCLPLAGNTCQNSPKYMYEPPGTRRRPLCGVHVRSVKAPAATKRTRKNSGEDGAEAASIGFHGRPVDDVYEIETPIRSHARLAELGELVKLEVKAINGSVIVLENFDGAILCMNPDRTQLYIEGGDQMVDLTEFGIDRDAPHDTEVLGRVRWIVYYTDKHHLGNQGGEANYKHRFGEEGGDEPTLIYDTMNGLLSFAGGDYKIPNEGIRN